MNKQEIFDKVAVHLVEQKTKAINGSVCMYEDKYGKRCAIGCLIPDGHNSLDFEGDSRDLLGTYPDLAALWNVDMDDDSHLQFLENLQGIHDEIIPLHWSEALLDFAMENNLDAKPFQNFLDSK